jgi:diadenosine tetraphosphatase ApaH/serine/threonine PP2A family protein phosphatase
MHGNAVALEAVFAHIKERGEAERIVCMGDIVGYGPQPIECVDLVAEHCEWSLLGNHDFAVLYEPTNFNPLAEASAYWTREQFDNVADPSLREQRYKFMGRLQVRRQETLPSGRKMLAVHGSPRKPINEYVFPQDVIGAQDKMRSLFELVDEIAVCGHTHVPGVFTDEPDFYPPDEAGENNSYRFMEGERAIINVGSVGQPRDHDPRASYAVIFDDRVEFHRVPYDIDKVAKLIYNVPELGDYLGERLYEGR